MDARGNQIHPVGLNRSLSSSTHHQIMYAPTCLVLISRHDYTGIVHRSLGTTPLSLSIVDIR